MGRTVARLRVCADAQQGSRRYMEDFVDLRYEKDKNGNTVAFFAVFDGHGGKEAALFARNRMWSNLKRRTSFYSYCPKKVCKTISDVFLDTHESMWPHREKWPMTESGYVSTSGCTASVVVIKGSHVFVAHVGDSSVVLAENCGNSTLDEPVNANMLTQDHQPQYFQERRRIKLAGGAVEVKKGVTRVVWRRPSFPGQVATRFASRYTNVPFLSVSRALGDLWSWNEDKREYIVSPNPDVMYFNLDLKKHKFLVIASDGVWNVFPPKLVIKKIQQFDEEKVDNVAEKLVSNVLARCNMAGVRSDNTSAIVIFFEEKPDVTANPPPPLDPETAKPTSDAAEKEGNMSSDNETEDCCRWAVDDVIVSSDSTGPAVNEDEGEDNVEEISQEPINNENDPKDDSMLQSLRNLIKFQMAGSGQALNEQTNIDIPSPLQFPGITPVKSAQKRRPEPDIDLSNLSPASKASKVDTGVVSTERKSTRSLSYKAAPHNKSESAKSGNFVTTEKNSETKEVAKDVENVELVDEKVVDTSDRDSKEALMGDVSSETTENTSKTTSSGNIRSPIGDEEAAETQEQKATVVDTNTESSNLDAPNLNPNTEENTNGEESSGTPICEIPDSEIISLPSAILECDRSSCDDEDNVEEEKVDTDFSGTTGISCTMPCLKPKGPPSGDQVSELSDENFCEETENSDPINFDLQSSAISGCNALTTLVLEICDSTTS